MKSSSSDSDSDEFEPIRKIKINIRPKGDVAKRASADVSEIKASVEAWRPLGPPTHPSLSRRQSSLSSVSSLSFGTTGSNQGNSNAIAASSMASNQTRFSSGNNGLVSNNMRSSPSCSSLVNEFNHRTSFSNFMSTTSRTSSPLTLVNHSDPIPIAIAIQESIELIVKGHYDPDACEPKFDSRSLGNIKIAFPNAFAKGSFGVPGATMKLRLHSTDNVIRYYASRLIKDLDLGATNKSKDVSTTNEAANHDHNTTITDAFNFINSNNNTNHNHAQTNSNNQHQTNQMIDLTPTNSFELPSNAQLTNSTNSKIIEFDMETLISHLKKMYDQAPTCKYYNIDVLRYQIAPIHSIEQSPLQVCAYWKVESNIIKLRIDFKHSNKSGLNLERLREITFTAKFSQFIPPSLDIRSISSSKLNNNNNNSGAFDLNNDAPPKIPNQDPSNSLLDSFSYHTISGNGNDDSNIKAAQSNLTNSSRQNNIAPLDPLMPINNSQTIGPREMSSVDPLRTLTEDYQDNSHRYNNNSNLPCNNDSSPCITFEPQAHWNNSIKQLTWKFDTLLHYHKTGGFGSLFAKLDFRNCPSLLPANFITNCKPTPVEVKFLVADSTLSKISVSTESTGYKLSLLKREIRSGKYLSEPYIL